MGKRAAAAILDGNPFSQLKVRRRTKTVFIRIHGAIAKQTVKRLSSHSRMAGKVSENIGKSSGCGVDHCVFVFCVSQGNHFFHAFRGWVDHFNDR